MIIVEVWPSTISITELMQSKTGFDLYKELAESGYKFKVSENHNNINEILSSFDDIKNTMNFVPFANLIVALKNGIEFKKNKNIIFDQLKLMGLIVDMNESEKRLYELKPTSETAISIAIGGVRDNNDLGNIVIYYDKDLSYKVVYVTGPAIEHINRDYLKDMSSLITRKHYEVSKNIFDNKKDKYSKDYLMYKRNVLVSLTEQEKQRK